MAMVTALCARHAAGRTARTGTLVVLSSLVLACGGDSGTGTEGGGFIGVEVQLDGNATSSEPVAVRWASGTAKGVTQAVELGGTVSLSVPEPGAYIVELLDVADHCYSESTEVSATVGQGAPGSAVFTVVCAGDFVYTSLNGSRLSYQATDGARVHDETGSVRAPIGWSPSGRFFMYGFEAASDCGVRIFDVETGTSERVGALTHSYHSWWAPSGDFFVVYRTEECVDSPGTMLLYDATTLAPVDSFPMAQDVRDVSWRPTTDSMTYSTGQDIRWHSWEDGSDGVLATLGADAPNGLVWSPTGDRLAVTRGSAAITEYVTIFDEDLQEVQTLVGADYGVGTPVWSPDGSHLALEITENTRQLIRVTDPDGAEVLTVGQDDAGMISVRWSPDGSSFLYDGALHADGRFQVYRATLDESFEGPIREGQGAQWADDGTHFLYISGELGHEVIRIGSTASDLSAQVVTEDPGNYSPRWRPGAGFDPG